MSTPALEEPVVFACEGERLCGIVHRPAAGSAGAAHADGVLVVVGGPQVRSGSHRQFVQLARRLAAEGHPVLRFDVRGMGDSSGDQRSFEDIGADIGAAIGALQERVPAVRRVVLWGLCDGASAALMYAGAVADARIGGLALLNPWLRSDTTLARTHVRHYYWQRLLQPSFWRKLLRGGVDHTALVGFADNVRVAGRSPGGPADDFRGRMAAAWHRFGGRILLIMSGADLTTREFDEGVRADPAWRGALGRRGLERVDLPQADHTLSAGGDRLALEEALLRWLRADAVRP